MAISYPEVRGNRYSWSSIIIKLGGIQAPLIAAKSINYDDKLTPVKVMGVHPQPLGRTQGTYEASASLEIYLPEWVEFQNYLIATGGLGRNGFKEVGFDIDVSYSEIGFAVITDRLVGCRVESNPSANSQGADPTSRALTLNVLHILWNGSNSLRRPLGFSL